MHNLLLLVAAFVAFAAFAEARSLEARLRRSPEVAEDRAIDGKH